MKFLMILSMAACAAISCASLARAETTAPGTTTKTDKPVAKTDKPAMTTDEKKAKSKECSAQADAKGLHGKERHKFREECKKG
jgi:hypothetical protein